MKVQINNLLQYVNVFRTVLRKNDVSIEKKRAILLTNQVLIWLVSLFIIASSF